MLAVLLLVAGAKARSHTGPAALIYRSMFDDDPDDEDNGDDEAGGDRGAGAGMPVYGGSSRDDLGVD